MRRKVKAGLIEADHEECAIVVHYEVEATVLGELGEPIVAERQDNTKKIKLKTLNENTNIPRLAEEILEKCKLIHASKLSQVEQLLQQLVDGQRKAEKAAVGASARRASKKGEKKAKAAEEETPTLAKCALAPRPVPSPSSLDLDLEVEVEVEVKASPCTLALVLAPYPRPGPGPHPHPLLSPVTHHPQHRQPRTLRRGGVRGCLHTQAHARKRMRMRARAHTPWLRMRTHATASAARMRTHACIHTPQPRPLRRDDVRGSRGCDQGDGGHPTASPR